MTLDTCKKVGEGMGVPKKKAKVPARENSRGEFRSVHRVIVDTPDFIALGAHGQAVWWQLKMRLGASGIDAFPAAEAVLSEVTGSSLEEVRAAIEALISGRWLDREGTVFWLRNALRYEPSLTLTNDNHRTAVSNHLRTLPKLTIVGRFARYYGLTPPFDEGDAPSHPPWDTPSPTQSHEKRTVGKHGMGDGIPHPYADQGIRKKEEGTGISTTSPDSSTSSLRSNSAREAVENPTPDEPPAREGVRLRSQNSEQPPPLPELGDTVDEPPDLMPDSPEREFEAQLRAAIRSHLHGGKDQVEIRGQVIGVGLEMRRARRLVSAGRCTSDELLAAIRNVRWSEGVPRDQPLTVAYLEDPARMARAIGHGHKNAAVPDVVTEIAARVKG